MTSPGQKLRIIVTGMVGQYPLGGVAWDYFHYLIGLHALGHDVYYHEDTWVWPLDPIKGYPVDDPNFSVGFLSGFFSHHAPQLADRWHYHFLHDKSFGMSKSEFDEVARTADIFLNVSGASFFPDALNPRALKVFVDTDPGYNQIMLSEKFSWSQYVDRWCKQVADHDRHLTYAENIWNDDCTLPRLDFDWRPTRCVVTLADWEKVRNAPVPAAAPFTTVMSWSFFGGPLIYRGREYGAKGPEFQRFNELPRRSKQPIRVAIAGQHKPGAEILAAGWDMIDGWELTLTPQSYADFIGRSRGEWSVAKEVYVATRTGWFSCRTACYLAAARPAVIQETGWSKFVPSGSGLFAFSDMNDCLAALDRAASDPAAQADAAYTIAREYLAADKVLPPMIDAIYAPAGSAARGQSPLPPGLNSQRKTASRV
jgi:hypothetical protein